MGLCGARLTVDACALARYAALAPGVSQRLAIANSDTFGGANAAVTGGTATRR